MKKIILALLLLILPLSAVEAYQHEPSGFGRLYWGMSVTELKKDYRANFYGYKESNVEQYKFIIDNANGELGLTGKYPIICTFKNNQLLMIEIVLPTTPSTIDKTYQNTLSTLTKVCGEPFTLRGTKVWPGRITFMGLFKREDYVGITMMDAQHLRVPTGAKPDMKRSA